MKKQLLKITFVMCFILIAMLSGISVQANISPVWPVGGNGGTDLNNWPTYSNGSYHSGTDISATSGTPVYSTYNGVVDTVKTLTNSYGKHIIIKCDDINGQTVYIYYCHLSSFNVSEGDYVVSGQQIGCVGSTGNSTGPHLHYEVRNSSKHYGSVSDPTLNPHNYLPPNGYEQYCNSSNNDDPVDLGDDFYAVILQRQAWIPITCDDDDFIRLHTERGDGSQLWLFRRQNDGSYVILSAKTGKALEMHNGNLDDGTTVKANNEDWGGYYQRWYIYEQDNGYVIMSKHFKDDYQRVLDLRHDSKEDGAEVMTYHRTNADVQIWAIYRGAEVQFPAPQLSVSNTSHIDGTIDLGGSVYAGTKFSWSSSYGRNNYNLTVTNINTNEEYYAWYLTGTTKIMTLPPGSYKACVRAYNYFNMRESNECTFYVADYFEDEFYAEISNTDENKLLTNDDPNVTVRTKIEGLNLSQLWHFYVQQDGSYRIVSCLDNKTLCIESTNIVPGTNIRVCTPSQHVAQQWFIYQHNDKYKFKNSFSNINLDMDGGKFYEGVNIQLNTPNHTNAQLFDINKKTVIIYNSNGGENAPNIQLKPDESDISLSNVIPKKQGYKFKEWNTVSDGSGTAYHPNDIYDKDDSLTLYAIWEEMPYTTIETEEYPKFDIVKVNAVDLESGHTIYLAAYKNDKLVDLQSDIYNGSTVPFVVNTAYDKIKVFVWDNLNNMLPLCDFSEKVK